VALLITHQTLLETCTDRRTPKSLQHPGSAP